MTSSDNAVLLPPHQTRRRLLIGAVRTGAALAFTSVLRAATEFWNAKGPAAWSDEEILRLSTRSPWAKEAVVNVKPNRGNDEPVTSGAGAPVNGPGPGGGPAVGGAPGGAPGVGPDGRGMGMPQAPPPGAGGGGERRMSTIVAVRWESAQPLLDALKTRLDAEFAGHYVISVAGLPGLSRTRPTDSAAPDEELERLQAGALLAAKGKSQAEAGVVRRNRGGAVLFGFSREVLPLALTDREIVFSLDTGIMTIKVRFDGREMNYHGKLAA